MCNCVCSKVSFQETLNKLLDSLRQQVTKQKDRLGVSDDFIREGIKTSYKVHDDLLRPDLYGKSEYANRGQFALVSLLKLANVLNCDLRITLLPRD